MQDRFKSICKYATPTVTGTFLITDRTVTVVTAARFAGPLRAAARAVDDPHCDDPPGQVTVGGDRPTATVAALPGVDHDSEFTGHVPPGDSDSLTS